jgi:hypothetical protein
MARKLDVLLRYCAKKGLFPHTDLKSVHVRMQDLLAGRRARDIFQLSNQRYIECIGNQTLNEGAVLMFEDVTQRVEAEARIQHMARYDGLTGLPNRTYFETMVRSCVRIRRRARRRRSSSSTSTISSMSTIRWGIIPATCCCACSPNG